MYWDMDPDDSAIGLSEQKVRSRPQMYGSMASEDRSSCGSRYCLYQRVRDSRPPEVPSVIMTIRFFVGLTSFFFPERQETATAAQRAAATRM